MRPRIWRFKNEITICQSELEAKIAETEDRGSTKKRARYSRWRYRQETRAGGIIVPRPAILLEVATHWPQQHSFPGRSANRCISRRRYLSVTVRRDPKPFLFLERQKGLAESRKPRWENPISIRFACSTTPQVEACSF